jgi:hypothetical protein
MRRKREVETCAFPMVDLMALEAEVKAGTRR